MRPNSKLNETLVDLTFINANFDNLDQTTVSFKHESELGEIARNWQLVEFDELS